VDFNKNRSTTAYILCNFQILEKNWECMGSASAIYLQLFKKPYNSVRREVS
jgi:hypothetical protein